MSDLPDTLPLPPPGLERVRHLMEALATAARYASGSLDQDAQRGTVEFLDGVEMDVRGYRRELDVALDDDRQRVEDDAADHATQVEAERGAEYAEWRRDQRIADEMAAL